MPKDMLSTQQVSNILGISRSQVTRLCKAGVFDYERIGRTLAIDALSVHEAFAARRMRGRPRKDRHAGTVRALQAAGYLGLADDIKIALETDGDIGRPEGRKTDDGNG